jgi:hypothetical protein
MMADENSENNTEQNKDETSNENKQTPPKTDDGDLVEKLVKEKLSEALTDAKTKLDKAYAARDEALKKVALFEAKEREENVKRLTEEGKHKEAFELQLASERAQREAAEKRAVELSRDVAVRQALSGLPFRNEAAQEMAFKEIVGQLIETPEKNWTHKSGVSIKDFVQAFAGDENFSFLMKPKTSSGSGNPPSKGGAADTGNKSLFAKSQAEVLQMAREGKLNKR